jgi:YD repeat-containing protein
MQPTAMRKPNRHIDHATVRWLLCLIYLFALSPSAAQTTYLTPPSVSIALPNRAAPVTYQGQTVYVQAQPHCGECHVAGNPIDLLTGAKIERSLDYQSAGAHPLVFERHYNSERAPLWTSALAATNPLGNWTHNWATHLEGLAPVPATAPATTTTTTSTSTTSTSPAPTSTITQGHTLRSHDGTPLIRLVLPNGSERLFKAITGTTSGTLTGIIGNPAAYFPAGSQPGPATVWQAQLAPQTGSGTTGAASLASADTLKPLVATPVGATTPIILGYSLTRAADQAALTFNLNGQLISLIERNGWTTTLAYSTAATPLAQYLTEPGTAAAPATAQIGQLIRITNHFGRSLRLAYDPFTRLAQLIPPSATINGAVSPSTTSAASAPSTSPIRYTYADPQYTPNSNADSPNTLASVGSAQAAAHQLIGVQWQDGNTRRYHYEHYTYRRHLTGITDELGVRIGTYGYDNQARAISSEQASGANRVQINYGQDALALHQAMIPRSLGGTYDPAAPASASSAINSSNPLTASITSTVSTTHPTTGVVTHSTPSVSNYRFTPTAQGLAATATSAPCTLCSAAALSKSFDALGRPTRTINANGTVTFTAYDAKGRITQTATYPTSYQTALSQPALNHATSVTSSRWHGTFNLPVLSTEPNRRVTVTYDVKGNITSFVDSTTVDPTGSIAAAGIASPSGAPTTLTNSAAVTRITRSQSTGWAYNAQQLPSTATYTQTITAPNLNGTGSATVTTTSPQATLRFTYDALGNLTQFTQTYQGKTETAKLSSYDAHGNLHSATDIANQAIAQSFNARSLITATRAVNTTANLAAGSPGTQSTAYTYTPSGEIKQVTYANTARVPATVTIPATAAIAATATSPAIPATLATSVTTSASAASTNTLLYSYDRSHKVVSIKWNGTEQYASTGVAKLIGSLTNEPSLSNGELATRLGVTTLEPLPMTQELGIKLGIKLSASTVNLAKDAILGREAKAAGPLVLIIPFAPEIGGALTAWGIRTGVMAVGAYGASQVMSVDWGSSGAASQIGQFTQDADGITRDGKNEICLNGNPDPDKCNGLYKAYKAAKKAKSTLGGCNGSVTNPADRLVRKQAIQKEIDTRQAHMKECFNGGDKRHIDHMDQMRRELANCS